MDRNKIYFYLRTPLLFAIIYFVNYLTFLTHKYHEFERYSKKILNEQKPIPPKFHSFFVRSKNNSEILCNEFFGRELLLVSRFVKTFFSAAVCVVSPASLLVGMVPTPSLAWKCFYREARYLAAESFELIGVLVCSILLLPLTRKNSHPLLNAQAWVEKKTEWISGEKTVVDSIQETIDSAKAKKKLLLQATEVIELNKEDANKLRDKAYDFDEQIEDIDRLVLKQRRICRNYESIPSPTELNAELHAKLTGIASIFSDKLATVAIPKQNEILLRLKRLSHHSKQQLPRRSDPSDSLETKLMLLLQLQSEINRMIDQLHKIHDPEHVLGKEIESLMEELDQAYFNAYLDVLPQGGKKFEDRWKEVRTHFFFVGKKLYEVLYIYSYKNVTHSDEPFSQTFFSDLKEQIAECRKLFKNQCLAWKTRNTTPLNCQRALEILSLPETATSNEIKKAYRCLSLIHHPDKGGQADIFDTIHTAYEFLTKN